MEITHIDILIVAAVAAMAPILADLARRALMPIVVVEIALGIIVGPELLGFADADAFIKALSTFGLAFLFFLAGMEIDFERIRGAPAARRRRLAALARARARRRDGALGDRGDRRPDPGRAGADDDGARHPDADPA